MITITYTFQDSIFFKIVHYLYYFETSHCRNNFTQKYEIYGATLRPGQVLNKVHPIHKIKTNKR